MSERRWTWAVALLKMARILDADAASVDDFQTEDLHGTLRQLETTIAACERDGLDRLKLRLPRSRMYTPKGRRQ